MTVRIVPGFPRKEMRESEDWQSWVSSLKDGDKVLFQQFVPKGDSCFDSPVECWRYWSATFHANGVRYDDERHPLKDGVAVCRNSDSPWGDVFPARVVPICYDLLSDSLRFVDGHAPIHEPDWLGADRNYVLVKHGPDFNQMSRVVPRQFKRCYQNRVHGGQLFTVFADCEEVEAFVNQLGVPSVVFLYSGKIDVTA